MSSGMDDREKGNLGINVGMPHPPNPTNDREYLMLMFDRQISSGEGRFCSRLMDFLEDRSHKPAPTMGCNPDIHHRRLLSQTARRSIRLVRYDYSRSGAYSIASCTHNRECIFGEIVIVYLGMARPLRTHWYQDCH